LALVITTAASIGLWGYYSTRGIWLRPKQGDIVETVYGLGTVISSRIYKVKTSVNLSATKIFVEEGDEVEKGAPLIQFDQTTTSRAPFAGTVTDISIDPGEITTPLIPVMTVTDLKSFYIEVSLEQQLVLRIKKGLPVVLTFENLRDSRHEGTVAAVYPRDDQFVVRISLERFPAGVLPGMNADTAIVVGTKKDALLVPLKTIVSGSVVRRRQGKKTSVKTEVGIVDGEWAELISGDITADDELLSRK
jgi:macrolide-specific efflux system membrane fusion protein